MDEQTHFQYCQKIVLFKKDNQEVLLALRQHETDYNGIFSFVGGKMITTDKDILTGLSRELHEELGQSIKIDINPNFSLNTFYRKSDGNSMILPHYYARYISGDIIINEDEYSEYRWVSLDTLKNFEPKIQNITEISYRLRALSSGFESSEFKQI